MPNPAYMDNQRELSWAMCGILHDWLIQIHLHFHLIPETLLLAINTVDCFLSVCIVSLAKLQLVGFTCLFIALKFEEIITLPITQFLNVAKDAYTKNEILQAERYVLKTLDWNLSYPNPVHFLCRVSKADGYDIKARTIAKYLVKTMCLEWRLLSTPPSLLAATAIWLVRLTLDSETWVCIQFCSLLVYLLDHIDTQSSALLIIF